MSENYVSLCFNPKFPYTTLDVNNDVEISIGIEDKTLYITFLGSVSNADWKHNFMFWKWPNRLVKPYKNMKKAFFAHYGFLKIYKICQATVHEWLKKEYTNIVVTGYSLGGAIATLCLEDISYLIEEKIIPNKQITALTAGSPRVFGHYNNRFISWRCRNLVRVVFNDDIVPSLPFGWYKHVGTQHLIGKRFIHKSLPIINIFSPSCVYNHDANGYLSLGLNYTPNEFNNGLYKSAVKAYNIMSLTLYLSVLISMILLLILRG